MSSWLVTNLLAALLLPPLAPILASTAGLLLLRRHRRTAVSLIAVSTLTLYGLSTPWAGSALLRSLETAPPVTAEALSRVDAIVVLGGGRRLAAAEFGGDTLSGLSLERLRYAARLHRASGRPLLVTGGMPDGGTVSEGALMRDTLVHDFGIGPRWVETASQTTWDNARLSAPLLKSDGVRRIALVTHAWHLRRAAPQFAAQGFTVVPAGVHFSTPRIDSALSLLPSPQGLRDSAFALHEWLGILWYKLRSLNT